jgi:serine/threonine protein kinase
MGSSEVLAPGAVFADRFRIVGMQGTGEMGMTYIAETSLGSAQCALKVMDAVLLKRDALRKRFVAEARSTSRVASVHLLQTREAGIDRVTGRPWFAADLLPGEDLTKRVSREGPLSLSEVRTMVAALGDALGKAHALGLVHYDLTPENIHVSPGKPLAVTLRELTISRLVADACAAEGNLFGTTLWMPPEQFTLGRPLEPSANVWSLGLIAFYAATGVSFWTRAHDDPAPSKALVHEILREPIVRASERASALGGSAVLPPWFDTWFARCVTRDARNRFPDARAAQASFVELMDAVPPERARAAGDERRSTTPPRLAPPRGRRSVPPAALGDLGNGPVVSHAPPTAAYSATVSPAQARSRGRARVRHLALLSVSVAVLVWLSSDRLPGERQALSSSAAESQAKSEPPPEAPATPPAPTVELSSPAASVAAIGPTASAALDPGPTPADAHGQPLAVRVFPAGDTVGEPTEYTVAAALKALNRVYYGDCDVASAGKVAVTFAPSGRVKKVALLRGDYDEPAAACIAARFGRAKMSPFLGAAQSVTADLAPTR